MLPGSAELPEIEVIYLGGVYRLRAHIPSGERYLGGLDRPVFNLEHPCGRQQLGLTREEVGRIFGLHCEVGNIWSLLVWRDYEIRNPYFMDEQFCNFESLFDRQR